MDFDGDGHLDLLSGSNCCDPHGFIYFRRRNDGTWEPRRELKTTIPNKPPPVWNMGRSFLTVADWNGDGVPDLLWLERNQILVATGPFKLDEPIPLAHRLNFRPGYSSRQKYVMDFAVADWDRDGKPDLLMRTTGEHDGAEITWHRNLGGPGLTNLAEAKHLLRISAESSAQGFCVCDWNADGRPDLMVTWCERLPRKSQDDDWQYRESVWLYLRK